MINSPLIRVLSLLNEEEMESLHQLVSSPFFNDVHRFREKIRLFEYIKSVHPNFDQKRLDKDVVSQYLWTDRSDRQREIEKVMALLLPLVRQFITFNFFAKASMYSQKVSTESQDDLLSFMRQELAMMRFFRIRLHEEFTKEPESFNGESEEFERNYVVNIYRKLHEIGSENRDFSHFDELGFRDFQHLRFQAEHEKARFDSLDPENMDIDSNILKTIELYDEIYISNKLYLLCSLIYRDKFAMMFKEDVRLRARFKHNIEITESIVDNLKSEKKHLKTPLISLHIALFDLLMHFEAEETVDFYAQRLSKMIALPKYQKIVPSERLDEFRTILRNIWNRRFNQTRDIKYLINSFTSYKNQIESLHSKNTLRISTVTGAIQTGLKTGQSEWVSDFLTNFDLSKIAFPDGIELIWDVYWSVFFTSKGQYEKAGKNLPHYSDYKQISDFYLYGIAAITDTKIRYGLGTLLHEESHNMVRATSTRMRRYQTISSKQIEYYVTFMLFATKIARIKEKIELGEKGLGLRQLEALMEEIRSAYVADKEWLLAQCEALK